MRSGILNSVHTFANDPTRGVYILIFLTLMIFFSVLLIFYKYKRNIIYNLNYNSKETFILINNWFMLFYLVTVLLGTIYPIFTEVLSDHKVSIGPPFYNFVIIPILIFFLFFMSLGPQVKWIKNQFNNLRLIFALLLGAVLINFLIIYFF